MTEEQIALARRAVACRGWRWLPGMATNSKFRRVVDACPVERVPCCAEEGATEDDCHAVWLEHDELLPDLTDGATLGCLLSLVREAWDDPYAFVGWFDPHWKVIRCRTESLLGSLAGRGSTEAEALVVALESAP